MHRSTPGSCPASSHTARLPWTQAWWEMNHLPPRLYGIIKAPSEGDMSPGHKIISYRKFQMIFLVFQDQTYCYHATSGSHDTNLHAGSLRLSLELFWSQNKNVRPPEVFVYASPIRSLSLSSLVQFRVFTCAPILMSNSVLGTLLSSGHSLFIFLSKKIISFYIITSVI